MTPNSKPVLQNKTRRFLQGGGEMGNLIRSLDFSKAAIGDPENWCESLRTAVNICLNSGAPMLVLCGENYVQIYNDAYHKMVGAQHAGLMCAKASDVWRDIWPKISHGLQKILKKEETNFTEDRFFQHEKSGYPEEHYFAFSYSPVYNFETESIEGIFCTVAETAKRPASQDVLKHQLNELFSEAPFGVSICYGENHVIDVANKRMFEIWGRSAKEVMKKPVFEALPEATNQGFEQLLDNVFRTGKRFVAHELPVRLLRNGMIETIFVKFVFETLLDGSGKVYAVMCLADEVTGAVAARKEVEDSEERLRLATEATNLGTWEFYPLEGTLNLSALCKKIYGFPPDKKLSYDLFYDHIHSDDKNSVRDAIERACDPGGTGNYNIEYRIVRFNDELVRWVKAQCKVFFDNDKNPVRFIGTILDITDAKLKEEVLRDNEERLRHAVDSGELGTYELDNDAGSIIFSSRLAEIFGLDSSKPMTHQDLKNAIHPDDISIRNKAQVMAKETGTLFYEVRVVWRDGSIRWVRVNGKVMNDDKGIALRTYGTVVDITDHKQSETILKQSEQELRLIADAIPHMVWVIDPDGTISFINKQWADWTGLTLEEINNGAWQKNFHPDDVEKVALTWQHSIENNKEYSGEYRIKDRDGNYFWFMGTTTPMRNGEGRIIKWIGTSTNIDEQKKIQNALKEREEQFRQLADSMPQIVWTAQPDGRLDYYNKKWYDFTGFEQGMDADAARSEILHPDDVEFCRQTWYNSVRTGKNYHIEYRFKNRKAPGTYCWYLGRALPIYNSEGKIVKWYGTCTDINDQKEIEALLKESEKRFRQMADSVPQHVWTAKADGGLDYVNQRAVNYFGKTAEEIIGEGKFDGIHPDDVPVAKERWQHSLRTNEPFQVEYRLKNKNNIYRWHLGRATPYANKYNEIKWFGTNTDIEEHKYGEQKKDEFISIASHELKTPITSLKGIVFILKEILEKYGVSEAAKLLTTMDNQLIKLTKLITDLLDVNNIEGNQLRLNREDFEFSELVKETVDSVQHISPGHSLIIESDEKLIYNGDKLRLEQVITNLLTNAVKYSPGSNKVIIRYEITDENIVMSVHDFGIGIEREDLSKLFDRFYRVHNSLRFGGLGLGLYISANIIKAHNGSFWIESEPGKGSVFYFLLPRNEDLTGKNINTDNATFYKDGQVSINYDKENKWIEANWTGFQNLESVQRGCLAILSLFKKNHCTKILNNYTRVLGNWSDAAEWGGNIWFPQMQHAGLQFFAWVYSPGTFSQMAAEKSIDVMTGSITSRFFNNVSEAEEWLKDVK